MSLMELKSGSDIRGTAVGEKNQLTDEVVRKLALAFSVLLSEKTGKETASLSIAIGHDVRISSERIKNAAVAAFTDRGVTVYDCGLSSTPAMFMTTLKLPIDGAVQITASHHPYDKNGLKYFTKEGGLSGKDIERIIKTAESLPETMVKAEGKIIKTDFMKDYAADLRKMIIAGLPGGGDKPLSGLKIVVDAGNGVGGFYAYDVLEPLGADISGSQFLEPDGYFPNHTPNPENADAIKSVSEATVKAKADLGIIFDTDVDRAACVDESGEEINRNRLVALASAIALKDNEGGTIVTDSVTSDGLKKFIENKLKGKHH
ncbi:MAG TPA: phosphomannomutase/phosphoglucomutase, partial [Clostridiales bacterium]|nr:phosphomannomutase/phosphoglucomutase [Clostridiales bacterium]